MVFLVYPTTIETVTRGKSFGKLASGSGSSATTAARSRQQSFVRALIGIVEIYALSAVRRFFSCLVSSRGKRLGDLRRGHVRRARPGQAVPAAPGADAAALAPWAASPTSDATGRA